MKLKTIFLLIVAVSVLGCNRIDKKNLEVIEGIQLGTTYKMYQKQIDSLGIQTMSFYTKSMFTDIDEIEYNQIRANISDIFNLSEFRNSHTNHYAILYPTTLTGTDNVIGLNVILGHTGNSLLLSNGLYDLTKEYGKSAFNQNISTTLLDQIKSMLTSKYGEPTLEGFESEYNDFYAIQGKEIKEYIGDENRKGKVTEWETDNLEIELFEGLASVDAKYSQNGYEMVIQPSGKENDLVTGFDWEKGERPCVTYVYIKYDLKSEAIKKLGLNDKKL